MLAAAAGHVGNAPLDPQIDGKPSEQHGNAERQPKRNEYGPYGQCGCIGQHRQIKHIYNLIVSRAESPAPASGPSTPRPSGAARWLYGLANVFQNHWLAIFTGILFVYSLLPFAAPLLKQAGLNGPAQLIYLPYKMMCHTYGFRSMYLFGPQFVYTRDEFDARTGLNTLANRGLNGDVLAARDFQGNPEMGYKVALCERDVALYFSMAIGGVIFSLTRRRLHHMPWWLFVLIGVLPIGLDGFSQLLSQFPSSPVPFRESNVILRLLTGSLFGFSVAWLVFPIIHATLENSENNNL